MFLDDYSCASCPSIHGESVEDLFLFCPSAQIFWKLIRPHINNQRNPFQILEELRGQINKPFLWRSLF
ncbi:hypothetical protein HU200_016802 [Digitaria exilis]|uniref:Reverse transcriptase zinc-binding domain-containing protein n=1 Tax=Digitaria exilis TaxID=1010633 RepID=A0A835KI64_9POAL|nr:hypothetical protein HU200_016802 [Digitaria exilis]